MQRCELFFFVEFIGFFLQRFIMILPSCHRVFFIDARCFEKFDPKAKSCASSGVASGKTFLCPILTSGCHNRPAHFVGLGFSQVNHGFPRGGLISATRSESTPANASGLAETTLIRLRTFCYPIVCLIDFVLGNRFQAIAVGVGKKFFLNDIICPLNDDFCCP